MTKIRSVRTPDEIDAVAKLAHEIWNEYFPPIIGQAQVDYMLAELQSPAAIAKQTRELGHEYLIVLHEGEHAGYFALVPGSSGDSMQLSKLYLKRAARGRGLGKTVIGYIEERCVACGIHELWLTVNKDNAASIAFYERVGFVTTDSAVTDIGGGFAMDDYRMVKRFG